MKKISVNNQTTIPTRLVGPIKIITQEKTKEVEVPLATFETPLWYSVDRGAKISRLTNGISTTIVNDCMTRSCLLEAPNANYALQVTLDISNKKKDLSKVTEQTSSYTKLQDWNVQIVGNLLYLRFSFNTGEAAGHNMSTKATEAIINWLLKNYDQLQYISISSNYCTDKKTSSVNGILGRGKYTIAEITIPKSICSTHLRCTPKQIVNLNIKKNLLGSILSGGTRTANAHFANILLAIYLATGQDAANIIEGSQGFVHTELRNEDLYFSVTLPNIIIGTIGNGKDLEFVKNNLRSMGCLKGNKPTNGQNAKHLAQIIAASVLCGELSLLAAQVNPGELMRSHIALERKSSK